MPPDSHAPGAARMLFHRKQGGAEAAGCTSSSFYIKLDVIIRLCLLLQM